MKISDSHTDFLTEIKSENERCLYIYKIKKVAGVISCAVFSTNSTIGVKDVENFKKELNYYNKRFKTRFLLSIEDLGFVKNLTDLKSLIKLQPISVSLTWNYKNQFAGGSCSNNKISKFGKLAVRLLEKNNILIDTAHLNKQSFNQFCNITTKPIYNSHSNIYGLHKHKRNLTDKQIQNIVDSNGFLGITVYKNFISNKNINCKDIAKQFDYLIKKFGCKNFGLGTDFYGIDNESLPTDFKSYLQIKNLIKELKKLKYSNKIINAIIYKNYRNFLKRNKIL